jgi:aspartyl-tRNA(Asn)/glutamyl-tRNA(Gln) amidotransferase subunit A
LRIGMTEDAVALATDCPVAAATLARASTVWKALGARVVPITMPHADVAVATYYILNACEASANMARYDGLRYGAGGDAVDMARGTGLGMEVKRRILMGTFALSAGYYDAYYDKAMRTRALVMEDHVRAFDQVDLLCSPVAAGVAPRLCEYASDPLAMYLSDRFTVPASLAGLPALAFQAGEAEGLPVGLQLTGPRWSEPLLHCVAHAFAAAYDALSPDSGGRP